MPNDFDQVDLEDLVAERNNLPFVETEHKNDSAFETHEVLAILLGALAARKHDRRLVIRPDEFENVMNNMADLRIESGPKYDGDFVVEVSFPEVG